MIPVNIYASNTCDVPAGYETRNPKTSGYSMSNTHGVSAACKTAKSGIGAPPGMTRCRPGEKTPRLRLLGAAAAAFLPLGARLRPPSLAGVLAFIVARRLERRADGFERDAGKPKVRAGLAAFAGLDYRDCWPLRRGFELGTCLRPAPSKDIEFVSR